MSDIMTIEGLFIDEKNSTIVGVNEDLILKVRQAITAKKVVILKKVLSKTRAISLRSSILDFWKDVEPGVQKVIDNTSPNYHRVDNNPEKSQVKMVAHNYVSYYWNNDVCGENSVFRAMSKFRNLVAGLDENFTVNSIEGDWITVPVMYHYPPGGGKINKHADPKTKQFCTMLCSLSKKGDDFDTGGSYVEKNQKICVEDSMSYGDMFLMDPTTVHGVDPIDPDLDLDWSSRKGRFVLNPALVQVKSLHGVKVKGLKDLDA